MIISQNIAGTSEIAREYQKEYVYFWAGEKSNFYLQYSSIFLYEPTVNYLVLFALNLKLQIGTSWLKLFIFKWNSRILMLFCALSSQFHYKSDGFYVWKNYPYSTFAIKKKILGRFLLDRLKFHLYPKSIPIKCKWIFPL